MLDNGWVMLDSGLERTTGKTDLATKAYGKMMKLMEKVVLCIKMGITIRDNGSTERPMVMEFLFTWTRRSTMENGLTTSNMDTELKLGQTVQYTKEAIEMV